MRASESQSVECPWFKDEYKCEQMIQDREVRSLLTEKEYDTLCMRSLNVVIASSDETSFICKTPDCKQVIFYGPDVTRFQCEDCKVEWCLKCKESHPGPECLEIRLANEEKLTIENIKVSPLSL